MPYAYSTVPQNTEIQRDKYVIVPAPVPLNGAGHATPLTLCGDKARRYFGLYAASLLNVRCTTDSQSSGSACRLERINASNCGAGRAGLK